MNMVNPDNEVRHFSRQLRVHIKEWLFRLQKLKIHVPDNVISNENVKASPSHYHICNRVLRRAAAMSNEA